jgi:hypothetical protein
LYAAVMTRANQRAIAREQRGADWNATFIATNEGFSIGGREHVVRHGKVEG